MQALILFSLIVLLCVVLYYREEANRWEIWNLEQELDDVTAYATELEEDNAELEDACASKEDCLRLVQP